MTERIELPNRLRISKTANELHRLPLWDDEKNLPNCPAGAEVMIETIVVLAGLATREAIEAAYVNNTDSVQILYRQKSGNVYACLLSDFSLGEAAIILQAVAALQPGESETDASISLVDSWARDFRERTEKEYANRVK